MNCAQVQLLLEEYVTGELGEAERAAVEAHLGGCAACRDDLAGLEEAAALLRLGVPRVEPPPALRRRILVAARALSQTPAVIAAARPAPPRPVSRRWGWRFSASQVAATLSALSLLVSLGLAGWVVMLHGELNRQAVENTQLGQQLERQRYAVYSLRETLGVLVSSTRVERQLQGSEAAPRARALVTFDPASRQGMIVASELPQPAPDRSYQIWLRDESGVISAGLLHFDERGTAYAVVEAPTPLGRFRTIGVSLEPQGGSPQPTGPRMMGGPLQ
jgi:anti-sigma-K factor RskA